MKSLDLFKLTGKVAIVTGGAQNLGRQHALALAEAGADVAICDLNVPAGEETCKAVRNLGRRACFGQVDVTQAAQIDAFVQATVKNLGPVAILVNNAAAPSEGCALEELSDDLWRKIIDTNLSSLFYFGKRVAREMIAQGRGGCIINIASISGLVISNLFPRHNVAYCTAKAGVAHLTRGMASEWAQYNIRVNAIAPGYIHTAQTAASAKFPKIVERITASTPLKRYGRMDELKGAILFLASDASSFATGSIVTVDGGLTIW
ncbi:MAG: SDR family oxidoreductase [Verrucomicrobiota bacterium]|nr:SDR family oxidoreductase [Verrucomicrobiota bacterium]